MWTVVVLVETYGTSFTNWLDYFSKLDHLKQKNPIGNSKIDKVGSNSKNNQIIKFDKVSKFCQI